MRTSPILCIKVGDKLPSVEVFENDPKTKVNLSDLFAKSKRAVLIGVPGAFTPGCSQKHLPSYVTKADELKKNGVDLIACVAVNDPFVMTAWGKDQKADGKVRMLADPQGKLAKALDLEKDLKDALGSVRFKRFAMLVENGKVAALNVEPDGTGTSCTLSDNILKDLEKSNKK